MKMNICILGTGDISHEFVKNMKKINEIELIAVYHHQIAKARIFANQYDIGLAYDSIDDVCNSDCNLVYNALPNSLHYQTSKKLIESKKNVIIEKPITSNLKELNNLLKIAELNDVMVFEVNRVLYNKSFLFIKEHIDTISPVKLVNISFCKISRKYESYKQGEIPNIFSLEFSGGALYDLGVYALQLILYLFGMPNEMNYMCNKLETGVDSNGVILLKYKNLIANISLSKISNGMSRVEIQGEKGTINSDNPPSTLNHVICLNQQNRVIDEFQNNESSFGYFLSNCIDIIRSKNIMEYKKNINISVNVMKALESLRNDANIVFKSDSC